MDQPTVEDRIVSPFALADMQNPVRLGTMISIFNVTVALIMQDE